MKIMYCVNCGNRLEKDASFCKLCGAKILSIDEVATKFCSNCGMKIPQTANFCSKCGIKQNNAEIIKKGTLVNNPLLGLFYKEAFKDDKTTLYTCLGWVCAVVSLFLVPLLFGAGGVVFGYLLSTKKATKNRGIILIIFSVAFALLGMLIGAAIDSSEF